MNETKTFRRTSTPMMRFRLTFAVAVIMLALSGMSSAFSCPLMTTAAAQEEPCSDCPTQQQESCPRSACLLICPYTVEKAAVVTDDALPATYIPQAARDSFEDASSTEPLATPVVRGFDQPLYLLNRALLI